METLRFLRLSNVLLLFGSLLQQTTSFWLLGTLQGFDSPISFGKLSAQVSLLEISFALRLIILVHQSHLCLFLRDLWVLCHLGHLLCLCMHLVEVCRRNYLLLLAWQSLAYYRQTCCGCSRPLSCYRWKDHLLGLGQLNLTSSCSEHSGSAGVFRVIPISRTVVSAVSVTTSESSIIA